MKGFEDNDCRLCSQTFCCPNCRISHEEKFHKVNPECEICIYGRASIKNASVSLLNHIKTAHWPLHCVFCKKLFTSFDDLLSHDKCPVKLEALKMEATPKTPIMTESEKPSPEVTPFYKAIDQGVKIRTMGATSTPLIRKESDKHDKITPINQSEIIYHKSSLKLTGSSNLSDSKKSDRRVTFLETPSVSEMCKKPKYLTLPKQITKEDSNVSNDDELELYKTAPHIIPECEEKENLNDVDVFNNCDSSNGGTLWESALTKLDFSGCSNIIEKIDNKTNNFNVSLQINVFSPPDSPNSKSTDVDLSLNKSTNIWSSVTNMVKSVVSNISMTAQSSFSGVGLKRPQPDNDTLSDAPHLKRMKLTDIKCRRPIRAISPLYQIRLTRPRYVDKATQTDESWM